MISIIVTLIGVVLMVSLIKSWYERKGRGISLLIPFYCPDRNSQRAGNWRWLKQYWKHHLPNAEIVMGEDPVLAADPLVPFSKSRAINNAASKAKGDIFVIVDADGYVDAGEVLHCAEEIRKARKRKQRLWYVPYRQFYRLTKKASRRILESDPRDPYRFPTPPDPCDIIDTSGSRYGHWYGAGIQVMPSEAFREVGGWDERFCVDELTQILTQQGWKYYRDLKVDDMVLTLNHGTGLSEWQPVKTINVFYGQHEMLSIESKTHSSLTTLNHNWPTVRRPDYRPKTGWGSKKESRDWCTSGNFTSESKVPMAAEHGSLPVVGKYGDAIVECVAWFWTEGSISRLRGGKHGRNVTISQSIVVNPTKCERIRDVLTEAFGKPSSFPRRGASLTPDIPRWNERLDRRSLVFSLNAEAGSIMQQHAPNRVPSYEFLLALTKPQLDLFIESSILGDGGVRRKRREIVLGQKNQAATDAFQFACVLAGHCTSIHTGKRMKGYDYGMTYVRMRQQSCFKLCRGKHNIVRVEGVVWCPTTENRTWLARRKGKTYFTGNSGWGGEDHAAMRAMDTLYWLHKTLPIQFLHVWHPMLDPTGDSSEYVDWKHRVWKNQISAGANDALSHKYYGAQGDPVRMRKLVDAGKDAAEHEHECCDCCDRKHHRHHRHHHHHHHRPSV